MAEWRWRNVPIPEAHLAGLGAGIVLHVFVARRLFPAGMMGHALGWPLIVTGLSVAVWATIAAGRVDLERPDRIVVSGPYARTRNPMYVAWTLIYAGIAFVVNIVWPLIILPIVLLLTHLQILREERELEGRFGVEYRTYRAGTRRYV